MISGNFLIGCLVTVNDNRLQSFYVEILIRFCSISWIFGKFPKFPYRGSKFSKVGNDCGNLSLPCGNLLVSDLRTLDIIFLHRSPSKSNRHHGSRMFGLGRLQGPAVGRRIEARGGWLSCNVVRSMQNDCSNHCRGRLLSSMHNFIRVKRI